MIGALNTQTDVSVNGLIPTIDWTTGHIDPVKHPEVRDTIACANFLVIQSGEFEPTFATADKPYVCLDNTATTVPDDPPTRNFVDRLSRAATEPTARRRRRRRAWRTCSAQFSVG